MSGLIDTIFVGYGIFTCFGKTLSKTCNNCKIPSRFRYKTVIISRNYVFISRNYSVQFSYSSLSYEQYCAKNLKMFSFCNQTDGNANEQFPEFTSNLLKNTRISIKGAQIKIIGSDFILKAEKIMNIENCEHPFVSSGNSIEKKKEVKSNNKEKQINTRKRNYRRLCKMVRTKAKKTGVPLYTTKKRIYKEKQEAVDQERYNPSDVSSGAPNSKNEDSQIFPMMEIPLQRF